MKDRGFYYGWFIVGVAFFALFLNYGIRNTSTVLFKDVIRDIGVSRGAGSIPFTVMVSLYAIGAPVIGKLMDIYGPRRILPAGLAIAGAGLCLCSRITNLATFILFFGVIFGIGGNGIGLVPTNTAVAVWFKRRMGLALGVASVGIGLGTVIIPPVTQLILSRWGWRNAFLFLGLLTVSACVPAYLIMRRERLETQNRTQRERPITQSDENPNELEQKPEYPTGGDWTLGRALYSANLWKIFGSFVILVIALYGVMLHQVPYATDKGISRAMATLSVTIAGIASIGGRFFFGWLSDKTKTRKVAIYPAYIMVSVAMLILIFVKNAPMLYLFAVIYGLGYAAYGPVLPALVADVFGKTNMGSIFGVVTAGGAIGGAVGPYITGLIYDLTGGYAYAWILGIACSLISFALIASVNYPDNSSSDTEKS